MKVQEKRLAMLIILALLVGVVFGALGYSLILRINVGSTYIRNNANDNTGNISASGQNQNITPISTTSSVIIGTSATTTVLSTSTILQAPVDMSNWKNYTNYELGFSIQYPPDLILDTSNPSAIVLTFPSNYFPNIGTAVSDSDSFSVTVSATCTQEKSLGNTGTAVTTILYTANNNNVCYSIQNVWQGQSSDTAQANIEAIVSNMVSTFSFANTPAGENEADYSAEQLNQNSQGNQASDMGSLIDLNAVSPSTVSVGGNVVLTGSGFSASTTFVWISNGSVQGVLWSSNTASSSNLSGPSVASISDTSITAIIPAQVCTQYIASVGTACPSYLVLSPGIYTLSVSNQNGTSQSSYIRIQ